MGRKRAPVAPPPVGAEADEAAAVREPPARYLLPSEEGERLLTCLTRAQTALITAASLDEVLEAVLDNTLAGLGWEVGVLCLLGPAAPLAAPIGRRVSASVVDDICAYVASLSISDEAGAFPVLLNPDDAPPTLRAAFRQIAFAPAFLGEAKPEGVILAATTEEVRPSQAEERFLHAMASLLALAVEYEALRVSNDQLRLDMETLHRVSIYVSEQEDIVKLLKSTLLAVETALRVSACAIYEATQSGKNFRCLASRNTPEEVVRAVEAYSPSAPAQRALKTGLPVVLTRPEAYTGAPQVLEVAAKAKIQSAMIVPIFVGGQGFGVLSLYHMAPREWTDAEIRLAQMIAGALGSALSRADSHRQLAEWVTRLRDLHHMSVQLMEMPDAAAVAALAAKAGASLIQADAIAVYEQDRRYGLLKLLSASPSGADHFPLVATPGRGVWGKAADEKKPIVQTLRLAKSEFHGVAAALPLQTQDGLIGVLAVLRQKEKGAFGDDEMELLGLLANLVAAAMQKARLLAHSEELGILKERNRIATEMHDSVGGDLAAILVKAQLVRTYLETDPQRAAMEMDWIVSALQGSVTQLRRVLHALRPVELDQQGFLPALRRLVEVQATQYGIPVTLDVAESFPRLGPRMEGLLYRAVSECLNNIRKHARATSASVSLRVEARHVLLTVDDNGCGFDPSAAAHSQGMGLQALAESVRAVGGHMEIASSPGQGTHIAIALPLGNM